MPTEQTANSRTHSHATQAPTNRPRFTFLLFSSLAYIYFFTFFASFFHFFASFAIGQFLQGFQIAVTALIFIYITILTITNI
jgi:hypothetical protein